ncbi:MAG: glycosyltransferase family 2 protein [Cyanobacteria bacterium J06632_22]
MKSPVLQISVVLCTYNRSHLLEGILQDLANQTLAPNQYEIIVVNNNSTDDTQPVAEAFAQSRPHWQVCFEAKQGLSHARNCGLTAAQGHYVAYVDDDCRVPADWLTVAHRIITETAPSAFGGPYYAIYNTPKPDWYKDAYGSHEQGRQPRPLLGEEYLDGGNFFCRRDLVAALGGFNPELGLQGDKRCFGEEVELVRKIRAKHPDAVVFYHPDLKVNHLVAPLKMDLGFRIRESFADGRSWPTTFATADPLPQHLPVLVGKGLARAGLLAVESALGLVRQGSTEYPYWQNYFYEKCLKHVSGLGMTYELLTRLGR